MSDLGPLVRLWGLSTAQLPDPGASADDLVPFLISILQESIPFIDSAAPKNFEAGVSSAANRLWKPKGNKFFSDSSAKVEVSERVVPVAELEMIVARNGLSHGKDGKIPSETWACRRSVHEDKAAKGTASWEEFVRCFKERHSESEEEFTPNIIGARAAVEWNCSGVEAVEEGERWSDFTLKVEEMKHKLGAPLKSRAFPVLQMTASATGSQEFLVVSISVPDFASSPQSQLSKEKGVVIGAYTSIERIRKLRHGEIEWIMATASDARGSLPLWMQTMAVSGIIAKDVQLFMSWIAKDRERLSGAGGEQASGGTAEGAKTKRKKSENKSKDKTAAVIEETETAEAPAVPESTSKPDEVVLATAPTTALATTSEVKASA